MKPIFRFLRTTLLGGILFLVPIIALVIVLGKALMLPHKFVDPLAARIPWRRSLDCGRRCYWPSV
jgi:hypothetical protein